MQMQTQLAENTGPSNILSRSEHILSFINHALTSSATARPLKNQGARHKTKDSLGMDDLRIVPEKDDLSDSTDSDDETPPTSGVSTDDEMIDTAVNLLLAILEGMSICRNNICVVKPHDGFSE
jgi:hypothetical protein